MKKASGQVHIQFKLLPLPLRCQMDGRLDVTHCQSGSFREKISLPLQRSEPSLPGFPNLSQCAYEAVNIFSIYIYIYSYIFIYIYIHQGRTESREQLYLHANWEQQTKESAVLDGASCRVIL